MVRNTWEEFLCFHNIFGNCIEACMTYYPNILCSLENLFEIQGTGECSEQLLKLDEQSTQTWLIFVLGGG